MSDNVIRGKFGEFKQKIDLVYQCPFCEAGQAFFLEEGGIMKCVACGSRQFPPDDFVLAAWEMIPDEPEDE